MAEGVEVLGQVPHQLSYNVTLCDRSGAVATVFIAPDRPARVTDLRAITNHPESVEWPEHASWVRSVERLELLCELAASGADDRSTVAAMLSPPLLARRWSEGFATLFTAAYRPATGRLDYRWPDRRLPLRLDEPVPTEFSVELDDPDGA